MIEGGRPNSNWPGRPRSALTTDSRIGAHIPAGLRPTRATIRDAADRLRHAPGSTSSNVVSDGNETCEGEPVAVVLRINSGRTRAIAIVIGFNLPPGEAAGPLSRAQAATGREPVEQGRAPEISWRRRVNDPKDRQRGRDEPGHRQQRGPASLTMMPDLPLTSRHRRDHGGSIDLTDRQTAGRPLSFETQAKALLKVRQDAPQAQVASYPARLTDAEAGLEGAPLQRQMRFANHRVHARPTKPSALTLIEPGMARTPITTTAWPRLPADEYARG